MIILLLVDLNSLTTTEAQKSLELLFSKFISRDLNIEEVELTISENIPKYFKCSICQDLEELGTALAFQLPGGGEAAGPTSSLSLVTTVVVLDIAQNCFNYQDYRVSQGEGETFNNLTFYS